MSSRINMDEVAKELDDTADYEEDLSCPHCHQQTLLQQSELPVRFFCDTCNKSMLASKVFRSENDTLRDEDWQLAEDWHEYHLDGKFWGAARSDWEDSDA